VFTGEYHGVVTIKSIDVLDPDKNFQPTGTNLVLSIKNENIIHAVILSCFICHSCHSSRGHSIPIPRFS
jgi:hypothetical protein